MIDNRETPLSEESAEVPDHYYTSKLLVAPDIAKPKRTNGEHSKVTDPDKPHVSVEFHSKKVAIKDHDSKKTVISAKIRTETSLETKE